VNQPIAHLFHHDLVSMGGWSAHGTGKKRHVHYLIKKLSHLEQCAYWYKIYRPVLTSIRFKAVS